MTSESVFYQFCKYVDETIFSDEHKGEVVAFIVDQAFIDVFCKEQHILEDALLSNGRRFLYHAPRDPFYAKGMIALQVFAATKRANEGGITERNYRDHLRDMLFPYDMNGLQRWMADYQDDMWRLFYSWCHDNSFRVSKELYPKPGETGRYVQYPLQEAKRVFTTEALLNFARAFVDNGLTPNDDCSFDTFWKIVTWRSLSNYIDSSNARWTYENYDDAGQQIYNYFLRWDGNYREANYSSRISKITAPSNCLYLSDNFETFEIRDMNQKLIASYLVSSAKYRVLTSSKNGIPVRRIGIFIFKRDTLYDVWEEVRFLEEGEEGIAVVFQEAFSIVYAFRDCQNLLITPRLRILRLTKESGPSFCFTEKRLCYLEGGLKVGRNQYLVGAAPFLVREEPIIVRIDKERPYSDKSRINLNYLKEGQHVVSVQGRKPIHFDLVAPSVIHPEWNEGFLQWFIQKKDSVWRTAQIDKGVSGMDFSSICLDVNPHGVNDAPSKAWAKTINGMDTQSNNIVVRTIKNIRDHGEL